MAERNLHAIFLRTNTCPDTGCRIWAGALTGRGRPCLKIDGRSHYVHRVVWELVNGPIPHGLMVCHICDNRECVEPDHLVLGTHKANMNDMKRKTRQARGTRVATNRLSEDDVQAIRRLLAGDSSNTSIAMRFGVHEATIRGIKTGRRWGWLR